MSDSRDEIAALRAQVARLSERQKSGRAWRIPAPVIGLGIVAAAMLFAAAYFGSPFLALHNLQEAARSGDRDQLENLVDFPRVREGLKASFTAYMVRSMRSDPQMANKTFAGLGLLIAPAIVDRAIDAYVTPDGIAALVKSGSPPKLDTQEAQSPAAVAGPTPTLSPSYADLDHFKVAMSRSDEPGTKLTLVLERYGLFGWKLVRIDFDIPSQPQTAPPPATGPDSNAALSDDTNAAAASNDATVAGAAAQVVTPLPAGYKQSASLTYADDSTVSSQALAALKQTDGATTLTEDVNGAEVTLSPRLYVRLDTSRSAIVLTGQTEQCHACAGVIKVIIVAQSGDKYTKLGDRTVQAGSWGEPAEVRFYSKAGSSPPLMRLTTIFTAQGCNERDGQLFMFTPTGLSDDGEAYSVSEGCPGA